MGHAKRHHLWIKLSLVFGLVIVYTAVVMLTRSVARTLDPAILTVAAIVVVIGGLIFTQGVLGLVLEKKADDFAASVVGTDAIRRALSKLADVNMSKRRTGFLWNVVTQHPGIEERVERLRDRPDERSTA